MALGFYATGSLQRPGGDLYGVSQPSMSRVLHQVTEALVRRAGNHISFLRTQQRQLQCDATCSIINVCTNFTGSCHDSYILSQSSNYRLSEGDRPHDGVLLDR
ncbi:HARB1 nuclease, partial [Polyodon spathula]|nr:HARB1 nuclease [Polyodon spathula]